MSHPSDGRRSIDSRQPLPPLNTELLDPSGSSLQQQQSWNRQPDERSPVTPGEGVGGGVSGQVGGVGGSGAGGNSGTDGNGVISHGNSPKSHTRICQKCGNALTGQFVRALGGTYHLDCFKCRVSTDFFISFPFSDLSSKHSTVLHPSGLTNSFYVFFFRIAVQ